ncbi:hypothetical protein VTL71DRAFT_10870 [Oculimacula yallundae]|uniref:Uncharacterized protein n=1 Tax=Oculimacula yallundae TaxID=86028 RepID=A0ABR4CUH0_9HELO
MKTPISILTVSASLHLSGHPISSVLTKQWSLASPEVATRFENIGYQVDPNDIRNTIAGLREIIKERDWDGIIFGWCVRGHVEFTELFEKLVQAAFEEVVMRKSERVKGKDVKIMFCEGPEGLVKAAVRNFPVE